MFDINLDMNMGMWSSFLNTSNFSNLTMPTIPNTIFPPPSATYSSIGFGNSFFNMDFMSMFSFPKFDFSNWFQAYKPNRNHPTFTPKTCDKSALISKLNSAFKGNLSGQGKMIVASADKYGLDPTLFAAIIGNESGLGKYGSGNNFGGLMNPRNGCMTKQKFATVEIGLDRVAANIRKNYINKGLTTPATIGPKYCPVGANNDPNGLNKGWIGGVTRLYNQLST